MSVAGTLGFPGLSTMSELLAYTLLLLIEIVEARTVEMCENCEILTLPSLSSSTMQETGALKLRKM